MALTSLRPRRQTRHVPLFLLATACLLTAQAPSASLTARDSAFHALNRLAYGARPGEADSVARIGVMRWIEHQLDADHVPDPRLAARERAFKILDYDRADLAGRYRDAVRERQRMQREAAVSGDSMRLRGAAPMREFRELGVSCSSSRSCGPRSPSASYAKSWWISGPITSTSSWARAPTASCCRPI